MKKSPGNRQSVEHDQAIKTIIYGLESILAIGLPARLEEGFLAVLWGSRVLPINFSTGQNQPWFALERYRRSRLIGFVEIESVAVLQIKALDETA